MSQQPVRLDHILPLVSKPSRYTGGEWNSVQKDDLRPDDLRVVLAYPDAYEIGISHLGLQILYEILNQRPDVWAERAYAPWVDMEAQMRAAGIPLFALESRHPVADFDIVGFTLPYELTFTNVLNMLDLAGLPVLSTGRGDGHPLVIAGGSCAFNPEPLAAFVDIFVIGEGEEVVHELVDAMRAGDWRPRHSATDTSHRRARFLREAARIPGLYVPSLYEPRLGANGVKTVPLDAAAPRRVVRRLVASLPFAPVRPVVPYLEAVHDRAAVEIMRGCARGCRFCQAGSIYRPPRERSLEETVALTDQLLANTGYDELGLMSLSSADHSQIEPIVREITLRHPTVNVSLPSLRVDAFSVDLARAIRRRKTGFTFAPEAGSQRLRDVINKHVTEEDALRAADAAFGQGWSLLKLYFMIGLPGETMDDVAGIAGLARQILALGRRHHGHRAALNVSVNTFSPKPHTAFQWAAQDSADSLQAKQELLRRDLRAVKLGWSDNRVSLLETAFARGDRRLSDVILHAWQSGAKFDAWREHFRFDLWQHAFDANDLSLADHAGRPRPLSEDLPWDHVDCGVSKAFLKREFLCAQAAQFTPDCHVHGQCSACGVFKIDQNCRQAARRV